MPVELTDEEFLGAPAALAVKELSDEEFLGTPTASPSDMLRQQFTPKPIEITPLIPSAAPGSEPLAPRFQMPATPSLSQESTRAQTPLLEIPESVPSGAIKTMMHTLPNITQALWLLPKDTREGVIRGLSKSISQQASGLTSPESISIAGGTIAAPEVGIPALIVYAETQLPDALKRVSEAKTPEEKAKAIGDVGGLVTMIFGPALGGRGRLKKPAEKPISPAGPVPPKIEAPPVEAVKATTATEAPAGEITAKVGTVAEPPIPEAPATLQEQVRLAADPASTRAAALITPGAEFSGQVPEGMKSTLTKHGTVIWNPAKVTEAQVTAAAKGDVFDNRILGGASGTKPVQGDTVVTTKTPAADDVQTALVPKGDAAAVEAEKKAQQAAVPGGTTEVKPAVEVLEKREAENATEKGQVQGGVPVERPRTDAQREAAEAGTSDSLRAAEEAKNLPPQEPVKPAETPAAPKAKEAAAAIPKAQAKVTQVARTEGTRSAKDIKAELVERLEKSISDAPSESSLGISPQLREDVKRAIRQGRDASAEYNKGRVVSELKKAGVKQVTIEIPGDGVFTVWNTKEALQTVLDRAKKINTSPTIPTKIEKSGIPKADKEWIEEQLAAQKQQPTPPPPEQTGAEMRPGPGEGPGARTAGTPATGGSQIEQLAGAFSAKAPAAERAKQLARESFDYGQRGAVAKDIVSRALSGLADSGRALWTALTKFDKPDELLQAKGVLSAELETRGWRVRQFDKAVRAAIPDKRRRAAMAKWIDAGGDDALLATGEAATRPAYKQAYRDARNLTPDEKIAAQNIQNFFDARLQEAIDAGVLEHGLEDYIHRIYPKDSPTRRRALAYVQSGILSKNPGLAKKRLFEYDWEAEASGLNPIQDFLPRLTDYETSLSKAIAAREFVKKLTAMRAPDGRPVIGVKGVGIPIEDPSGVRVGTLIKPLGDPRKAATPGTPDYRGDYKVKEYPALSRWKWVAEDTDGKPIFVQGDVAIHPDFISRFESLLEPSHVRYGSNEKLAKLGRGALGASTTVKQTMLDLSGFHQVQIGLHAMEHRVFPWQVVKTIDFADPKVEGLLKGGVTLGGEFHDANFGEGLFGKSLSQHVPILGPLAETYHNWLFQSFIPRVKMTMALHALERNRTRYAKDLASGRMTEDDLNLLTAKQANAAFGELNYIMLERNKTIQDMARLTLLAPDFLEARGRFVAQALTKYGTEQRVALLLGAATLFTLARLSNKIADDQYHWEPENLFSLVYKNRAYSLRTVQGDVLHLLDDPITFWMNRLNPTFSRFALEAVSHRDQFGRKRSVPEAMLDTIKNIQPIATRFGRERKLWESIMSAFGGTVRRWNDVDKAFKMAQEWKAANNIQQRGEFIYDPEKDPLRPLKIALSYGEPDAVQELVKMTPAEVQKARDYFQRYINLPFTGSRDNDVKWMKTLSTDQRQTVEAARLHRQDMGRRFMSALAQYRSLRANPPTAP